MTSSTAPSGGSTSLGPEGPSLHMVAARRATTIRRGTRRWLQFSDLVAVGAVVIATSTTASSASAALAVLVGALIMAWLGLMNLYRARVLTVRIDEWRRLTMALCAAFASTVVLTYLAGDMPPRTWLFATSVLAFTGLAINREIWRYRFTKRRGRGEIARRTILVGANPEADMLADQLAEDPTLGYRVVHRIDPTEYSRPELLTTDTLSSIAKHHAESALIAGSGVEVGAFNRLCRDLVEAGVHVELSMSLIDIMHRRLTLRPLGRFPVAYLEPVHRQGWRTVAKRGFDIAVSAIALILLSPALAIIAAVIRATSHGPIIFRQQRVGRDGRSFDMLKFRTMVDGAEGQLEELIDLADTDGPLFKMREDPRVTRIGRVLRRTSLDEVPQLFNVLRGEMSLVGPRPALRSEMAQWSPELYGRLRVRPGITGLWQVSGRSETGFDEYTRLDLYYVDNWSLTADLRILARTVTAVARSAGAY